MKWPVLTSYDKIVAAVIIAVILIVVIAIVLAHRRGIPVKDQHSLDSLAITKPIFNATQDTLVRRETLFVRRVDTLRTVVTRLETASNVLHARADSFATVSRVQSDSAASKWHIAYDLRTAEVDTLRAALDSSHAQWSAEHQARIAADTRASNATTRLAASEDLNSRLAADIKRASECKVLLWSCPSRTAIAVTGLVLGAAAGYELSHRAP
jgi:hypothetical protein